MYLALPSTGASKTLADLSALLRLRGRYLEDTPVFAEALLLPKLWQVHASLHNPYGAHFVPEYPTGIPAPSISVSTGVVAPSASMLAGAGA